MSYEKYTISTITYGRSHEEERRIARGLRALSAKHIPTIIASDGGSSVPFLDELQKIPNVRIVRAAQKGLFPQVTESLQKAGETDQPYIFYTESDKARFFEQGLDEFIAIATDIAERDAHFGLIIPARNQQSFSAFPPFQQDTESSVNGIIDRLTNQDEKRDYLYGPKIVAKSLIPYLEKVSDDIGWGWMSYLAIIAHRLNKTNYTVSLDLPTPAENENEDEEEKLLRLKQMRDHFNGIYLAMMTKL